MVANAAPRVVARRAGPGHRVRPRVDDRDPGLAGLSLDGGRALAAKITANGQAEAAARAGAQAIDLTVYRTSNRLQLIPTQAVLNAESYLSGVGASGTVTVSGDTVTVTITASQTTQLLGLVGISSLTVHATGSAHLQRGVVT